MINLEHLAELEAKAPNSEWVIDNDCPWRVKINDGPLIVADFCQGYGMTSRCNNAELALFLRNHCKQIIAELKMKKTLLCEVQECHNQLFGENCDCEFCNDEACND